MKALRKCQINTVCPTLYWTRHFFNNFTVSQQLSSLQTHSSSFLIQKTHSCSNFVAISSLVLELLKKCRLTRKHTILKTEAKKKKPPTENPKRTQMTPNILTHNHAPNPTEYHRQHNLISRPPPTQYLPIKLNPTSHWPLDFPPKKLIVTRNDNDISTSPRNVGIYMTLFEQNCNILKMARYWPKHIVMLDTV